MGKLLEKLDDKQKSYFKKVIPIAAFIGGLCCFSPLILFLLGLSTATLAGSLADNLYYNYRWYFRGVALLFLLLAIGYYYYKHENVCTLDAVKQKRRKIINTILVAIIVFILAYLIWLYVIVEIVGIWVGVWGNPFAK